MLFPRERLKTFSGFKAKKALINNFIMSNLSYCFFAWFISSTKSLNKVENVQTRALRFLHNNYIISSAQLPEKSAKAMIKIRNHRTLCLEIFKTLNNFMSRMCLHVVACRFEQVYSLFVFNI